MSDAREDVFNKLEAAITEWDAQISDTQVDLSDRIARAKHSAAALGYEIAGEPPGSNERPESPEGDQGPGEALAEFETAPNQSGLIAQMVAAEIAALRAEVAALLHEQLSMVQKLAAAVKNLESRLQPGQAATSAESGEPSAYALDDRDEALARIVRLHPEMETLRGGPSNAGGILEATEIQDKAYGFGFPGVSPIDADGNRRRLGEILCDAGALAQAHLENALSEQATPPYRRLGDILVEKGLADAEAVGQALACQLQLPFVRLSDERIDHEAAELISGRVAAHHGCIPFLATPEHVVLAMSNPLDLIAMEDVELASNRSVEPVVATPADVSAAIEQVYGPSATQG